jgi:hypothetical protein
MDRDEIAIAIGGIAALVALWLYYEYKQGNCVLCKKLGLSKSAPPAPQAEATSAAPSAASAGSTSSSPATFLNPQQAEAVQAAQLQGQKAYYVGNVNEFDAIIASHDRMKALQDQGYTVVVFGGPNGQVLGMQPMATDYALMYGQPGT